MVHLKRIVACQKNLSRAEKMRLVIIKFYYILKINFDFYMVLRLKSLKKNNLGVILTPKIGEIIEGKVIGQEKGTFYLDLGPKGIGIIYGAEFTKAQDILKNLKPGEKIAVKVLNIENEQGYRELSVMAVLKEAFWEELKKIKEKNEIIEAKILKLKKGGLLAEIKNSLAFLPFSLVSPSHYSSTEKTNFPKLTEVLEKLVGQTLKTRIIELDPKNKRIILSEREPIKKEKIIEKNEILKKYKVGELIEGRIDALTTFGIIVELEEGLFGILYSTEIPQFQEKKIEELFNIGQKIKAKIIKIIENNIYLSLKDINHQIE